MCLEYLDQMRKLMEIHIVQTLVCNVEMHRHPLANHQAHQPERELAVKS